MTARETTSSSPAIRSWCRSVGARTPSLGMFLAVLAVFAMAANPIPAYAIPGSATPSLSVEQAYDSNVFNNRTGDEQEDYILRIRPAVSFAFPAVDTAVNLDLSAETETYYNNPDLNEYPATWRAVLSPVRPIVFGSRFSMTPKGYFLETYNSSRRSQLLFSPEAPTIPIDITQTVPTHTRDYGGSVDMIYQAAPKFQAGLTGAYNRHESLTDNTGLIDYYAYNGDLSLSYLPGPRSSIGIFGSAGETTYSSDLVSTVYSVGFQGSYNLSELFRMDGRVGKSFLRNKPGGGMPESTDQSPTARFSINYQSRDFSASAWGSYGYSFGSSPGVASMQGNAGLSFGDQFSKGWWWSLIGSYQANRNMADPSVMDSISGNGTAEIRYVPVPWATVRLSCSFFRELPQNDTGFDMSKTTAFVGITMSETYSMY